MVSLKVAVETSDAVRGLDQTGRALDTTGAKAENMGRKLDGLQDEVTGLRREVDQAADAFDIYGLNATKVLTVQQELQRRTQAATAAQQQFVRSIGATAEIASIGSRVRLLGEEVRNLGSGFSSVSSVGFALSGALIDVAQVSAKATGGIGALTAAVKANPLLAAATVITGIATAMSLFAGETRDTNSELSKQIRLQEELRRASSDLATQLQRDKDLQDVGFPIDAQANQLARSKRLAEVASGLSGVKGYQTFDDLQRLTGLSEQQLRLLAPQGGVAQEVRTAAGQNLGGMTFTSDLGLTNEAARKVLLLLAENIKANADLLEPGPAGGTGRISPEELSRRTGQGVLGPSKTSIGYDNPIGPMPGEESPFSRVSRMNEIQASEQALEDFNRRLAETRQLGLEVGTALGNTFFGVVQNARNASQVLAGLIQQFGSIAQATAVRGFANSFSNLFAPTAPQQATTAPGGVGPPMAPGFVQS